MRREVPPGASPVSGLPPPVHTRWKPGQSGNPGGRPKGRSITARLRAVLEQEHNGRALIDLLAERIAKEALSGKFAFAKEVWDRLDGKTPEKIEVSGEGGTLQRALDAMDALTGDDLIELAVRHNHLDLLPPGLRDLARNRLKGGTDA